VSVVGIGTDILEIARLSKMSDAVREKLARRLLTDNEYQKYQQLTFKVPYLAKRWAGKEAMAKAIGTGIADGVSFQHIEIISLESGKPVVELSGRALELVKLLGANHWHISLSDEESYATAFVVLSK